MLRAKNVTERRTDSSLLPKSFATSQSSKCLNKQQQPRVGSGREGAGHCGRAEGDGDLGPW